MSKWRIGDVTITKVIELEVTGGSRFLLPQATPEAIKPIAWLRPHFADENGRLRMSIHTFLVQTPTHRIVVDTCLGNDKENRRIPHWNNMKTKFLEDIAEARLRPRVDRYRAVHASSRRSCRLEHDEGGRQMGPDLPQRTLSVRPHRARTLGQRHQPARTCLTCMADSVTPILDAGLATLVEYDHKSAPKSACCRPSAILPAMSAS